MYYPYDTTDTRQYTQRIDFPWDDGRALYHLLILSGLATLSFFECTIPNLAEQNGLPQHIPPPQAECQSSWLALSAISRESD